MTTRARIIGSYRSPYVRKVLACLDLKGVAYEIDPIVPFMGDDRFSETAAFVDRVLALESFEKLKPFEDRCMRTSIPRHRSTLAEMGAPLSSETLATAVPRRGIMRI